MRGEISWLIAVTVCLAFVVGCTSVTDPVVGTWKSTVSGSSTMDITFQPDNVFVVRLPVMGGVMVEGRGSWKKVSDGEYETVYSIQTSAGPLNTPAAAHYDANTGSVNYAGFVFTRDGVPPKGTQGTVVPTSTTSRSMNAQDSPVTTVQTSASATTSAAGTQVPIATATTQVTAIPASASGMTPYHNNKFGFSINYPSSWTVEELNAEATTTIVRFAGPFEKLYQRKVQPSFTIEVLPETYPDLEKFFNVKVAALGNQYTIDVTTHMALLYLNDDAGDEKIKAYRIDYLRKTRNEPIEKVNIIQVYSIIDGKPFIFTFLADPEIYGGYIDEVHDMIESYDM